jgi:Arc/MetJ-type ribon-helix-helix transcriptional regulator
MPKKERSETAAKAKGKAATARRRIDVRLTEQEAQRIEQIVAQGHYFSKADFARTAVREKLSAFASPAEQRKASA